MKMKNHKKVNLTSSDLSAEKLAELRRVLPEAFGEDKIDWDKLRAVLGDKIDERIEKFNFSWAGKTGAIQNVLTPSKATLRPAKKTSPTADGTGGCRGQQATNQSGDERTLSQRLAFYDVPAPQAGVEL